MRYIIPLSQPNLTKADFKEIKKCFDSSWISSKSPWVEKFENLFAKKVSQTKYAVAVNSGTSALFLALKALGIGHGDEVIVPSFTMIATINAVTWVGATPVLIDCQSKQDWNISYVEIEKKITKKTKVIIPVHIYGYPCQMDKIIQIAQKYRLSVIEDAAEAMGTIFQEKNIGSFGDISCFSLYSNKIITTGNGGVVATNSSKLYHLIKQLSFFDFNPQFHFLHHKIGYNLVLSGLQASLGISQLNKFDKLLEKRRQIFDWYHQLLNRNRAISFIVPNRSQHPNYWFPAIIFKSHTIKQKVKNQLENGGIETRDFFIPLYRQPVYLISYKKECFPLADYFSKNGLLLPSYYELTKNNISYICKVINTSNQI